ncbi:MAG: S26 family signal peptidase, partial [Winogradskyella sp.]|nr:S26 family signal peptidase [Winogradskyella sp.]
YKPIDKKTNLVKRCVATPGDTLEIRDGYVFINGKQNVLPPRSHLQFSYRLTLKKPITTSGEERLFYNMLDKADIDDGFRINPDGSFYLAAASDEAVNKLRVQPNVASVERVIQEKGISGDVFPRDTYHNDWNTDHFGPLWIPKAGATVELNIENIALYKRAIGEYEGNEVVTRGNEIYINDQPVTSYTFKQDYYWMMGDNRNNSIDSRYWGFVPYDHIFGKPVFIWMSIDGLMDGGIKNWKFRWDRIFTTVSGSGERTSYFIPFLVVVLGIYGFNKWRKKKKASAS